MLEDVARVCDLSTETVVKKLNDGRKDALAKLSGKTITTDLLLSQYKYAFILFFTSARPEKVEVVKPKVGSHHYHANKYRVIELYEKPAEIEQGQCTLMQRTVFAAGELIQLAKMLQGRDAQGNYVHDQDRVATELKSVHGTFRSRLRLADHDMKEPTEEQKTAWRKRHCEMPSHYTFYCFAQGSDDIPSALVIQIKKTMQNLTAETVEMIDIIHAFVASDPSKEFEYTPEARVPGQVHQTGWQPTVLQQQQQQQQQRQENPDRPQRQVELTKTARACIFI